MRRHRIDIFLQPPSHNGAEFLIGLSCVVFEVADESQEQQLRSIIQRDLSELFKYQFFELWQLVFVGQLIHLAKVGHDDIPFLKGFVVYSPLVCP